MVVKKFSRMDDWGQIVTKENDVLATLFSRQLGHNCEMNNSIEIK